jgi:hypothetical protein
VSDLCARTILLDAGAIVADGPTSDVLQTYLARERAKLGEARDTDAVIQSVTLRNAQGSSVRFSPGDKAWVDVEFHANRDCENVAVVLTVLDESLSDIFHTSSERLDNLTYDMKAGETMNLTFELDMHLAVGTFHVGVYLYRYDLERDLDRVLPAATFFVASDIDVGGSANLYPKIIAPGPAEPE